MQTRFGALQSTKLQETVVAPEGVSFDGSTDYLSRSSDLVGNIDSKTFTFSCWVYLPSNNTYQPLYNVDNGEDVEINATSGQLYIRCKNASNITVLQTNLNGVALPRDTFFHVLVSFDLSNASNRYVYISDVDFTSNMAWTTYTNSHIDFTNTIHKVQGMYADYGKGRLSNLFLDYTYRDLSIEANRRLFITADGKPADGLASLNPILYLPMKDASTAHINEGTGGDFVQNGTLATADRGANQDNCVASKFDGVNDYLSKDMTLISSVTSCTASCNFTFDNSNYPAIFSISDISGVTYFRIMTYANGGFDVTFYYASNSEIANLAFPSNTLIKNREYNISLNIEDTSKVGTLVNLKVLLNNVDITSYGSFYQKASGQSFSVQKVEIGKLVWSSAYYKGSIGELYFDTNYIDLSTNNPFWDSDTNKPIPARKAMETLGSSPLICMPISADNPTVNYGSGGSFTLNGGGLVGSRGASEFISRSAKFDGSTGYLSKAPFISDSKTFSISIGFKHIDTTKRVLVDFGDSSDGYKSLYITQDSNGIQVTAYYGNGGSSCFNANEYVTITSGNFTYLLLCVDVENSLAYAYNGRAQLTATPSFVNQPIAFSLSGHTYKIGKADVGSSLFNSDIATVYFTTDYIDFSQESNRNLFVNQLGYPRDLQPLIDAGTIPTPLIYLPFDDTTNLGKNLGTGGDFTVNGSITQGADFNI